MMSVLNRWSPANKVTPSWESLAVPRIAAEDDWPDDDEGATVPCPYCKREIHEDSVRCPHCESYISEEDRPAAVKPWWIVIGIVLCLFAVYRWVAP
jgi:hypothetical protein